jgi:CLIP-associating protein 1/2
MTADKSQRALNAILVKSTAHPRLFISHIHAGIQDKNVQTRIFATGHLKTFLDVQGTKHRTTIENTPNMLDTLVDTTKKGLNDVNPGVREAARPAFWAFNAIWPKHGDAILAELDITQKKQLDKVRPEEIAPLTPARPSVGAAKKSSGIGALLAEKRRAAMAARQDTQRTVSSPVPGSPSLGGGRIRSVSTQSVNKHDDDSPDASPTKGDDAPNSTAPKQPQETPVRSKMANMSLASPSRSPTRSPLAQKSSTSSSDPMSASSSVASQALRTPSGSRTSLSSTTIAPADQGSPQATLNGQTYHPPVTPARPGQSSKSSLYPQTPMNGHGGNVWEDSPGPTAVTPMMVDKLKERRHERSWWIKRQQCESTLRLISTILTNRPGQGESIQDCLARTCVCGRAGRCCFTIWYTRITQSTEVDTLLDESSSHY